MEEEANFASAISGSNYKLKYALKCRALAAIGDFTSLHYERKSAHFFTDPTTLPPNYERYLQSHRTEWDQISFAAKKKIAFHKRAATIKVIKVIEVIIKRTKQQHQIV